MKKAFFLTVLFLLVSLNSSAQERWAVEFRPQVNFPTQQPDAVDLKTGFGFEAMASYRFMPHFGVYVGWGWNNFHVDDNQMMNDLEFEETGYTLGVNFIHPMNSRMSYLLGAGAIYKHFEAEESGGNITADSGHEWGWEALAGVVFEFGRGFDLRPQVVYRSLSAELGLGTQNFDLDLQYLSIGLGIAKRF